MRYIIGSIYLFIALLLLYVYTLSVLADEGEDCLAEAVYYEARSESFEGKLAVANVILERLARTDFPDTICKVVHDGVYWKGHIVRNRCAFSYYCDGKPERMLDIKAKADAYEVANLALNGVQLNNISGCTHYHAVYVHPRWADEFYFVNKIGKHLFYIKDYNEN